jgi:hypothetical protein
MTVSMNDFQYKWCSAKNEKYTLNKGNRVAGLNVVMLSAVMPNVAAPKIGLKRKEKILVFETARTKSCCFTFFSLKWISERKKWRLKSLHSYTPASIYKYIYKNIKIIKYVSLYMNTHTHTQVCTLTNTPDTHTYAHRHTHVRILTNTPDSHTQTHTYTHTYTRSQTHLAHQAHIHTLT